MASKTKDNVRVMVTEENGEEMRVITVTITAPAAEFILSDLLRQRGAVGPIDAPLKQAVRECVQSYLDGTEELIASLAASQKKTTASSKPKLKEAVNGNANGASNGLHSAVITVVPSEAAEDVLLLQ